ncbi:hypothetical protein GQ53DRAFT_861592 [Thozetella sp. PMI_491]|nr:hypothetical protein GQ53DRAFT_861592 [Thozetella sp. PMI_491]
MSTASASTEAKAAAVLLDEADGYLSIVYDSHKGQKDTLEELEKHEKQLNVTKELLDKISFEDRYQTPVVAAALPPVKEVVAKLVEDLGKGQPPSLRQITKDIGVLSKATRNLQSQLPGNYFEALRNKANGGFQTNNFVGKMSPDQKITSIANDNDANNAFQINGPWNGDPTDILRAVAGKDYDRHVGEEGHS